MTKARSQPVTVILSLDAAPGRTVNSSNWQNRVVEIAKRHDGLVDVDQVDPIPGVQDHWILMFKFETIDHLRAFLDDDAYNQLVVNSETELGAPITQQVVGSPKTTEPPVTVVISQTVKPGFVDVYKKWQLEIDKAASKYPGFLGTESVEPVAGVQDAWVVIFRFDTVKHLDEWFTSNEHDRLKAKAEPYFEKVDVRRVSRGFDDWFANASGKGQGRPPQWKMAMVILLVLYPTVMVLTLLVSHFMAAWPLPHSVFVSNILSVALMTWLLMPMTTRALDFWLAKNPKPKRSTTLLGGGLVAGLYVIFIVIFTVLMA